MRPLNLGETLDASIKIVRSRWRTLATVMLVIALPIQLANIIIIKLTTDVYQVGTSFSSAADTATTYSNEDVYVAGQTAIIALGFLGYLLGIVACYRAIADTYLGRETSARASLRYAGDRLGATLWLTIVLGIGLLAGFLAFLVPGVWLYIAWAVAYPVMLVEGTGGVAALKRSFTLTQTRWWATAGRMIVTFILVGVVTVAAALLFLAPTELFLKDTSFGALILEHVANLVVSLVTTPFVAAVTTLVYFDLRVRKEGFDPALLAEGQGRPVAFGPPAPPSAPPSAPAAPPPLWSSEREGDRDAFGQPIAPRETPAPYAPPVAPAPPEAPSHPEPTPGSWAPPVAPEPERPPSQEK
ncbi:MAG: glycerophosphoryl diester phosphodiesterase membrane domain-containing protein [Baekduia sp.]